MDKMINIRMTTEMWKKIKAVAQKESRTVTQQVRYYIEKGLK